MNIQTAKPRITSSFRFLTCGKVVLFLFGIFLLATCVQAEVTFDGVNLTGDGEYSTPDINASGDVISKATSADSTISLTGSLNVSVGADYYHDLGTIVFGNGTQTTIANDFNVRGDNSSTPVVTIDGVFNVNRNFVVGKVYNNSATTGLLNITENAIITVNGFTPIGNTTNAVGTVNQSGGTITILNEVTQQSDQIDVRLGAQPSSTGTYNLSGGTLNALNRKTGIGYASNATGTLEITGGTANLKGLVIANNSSATGTLNVYGGELNIGSGGVAKGSGTVTVNLGQGTIGALDTHTWNTPITLTGRSASDTQDVAGGVTTFSAGEGKTITISSVISGVGGLTKTGAGSLTLDGYNTYTGGTTVTAGTLTLNKTGNQGTLAPGSEVTVSGSTAVLAGHEDILGYKYGNNSGAIGKLTLTNGGTFKNDTTNKHITINNVIYMNDGIIYATGNGHSDVGNFNIDNTIHVTGGTNNAINATKFNLRNQGTNAIYEEGDYAGKIEVKTGAKLTINSTIITTNNATLTKTGEGTLTFSSTADNSIGVNVAINEGVVVLSNSKGGNNRFAGSVSVTINSGATLQCDAGDSIGYGNNNTTFNLYGGTIHLNGHNETIVNKTINLKGGSITSTGTDANHAFGITNTGTTFRAMAESNATAANPTVSTVSAPVSLRNSETFSITVDNNAKLVFSGVVMDGYGYTDNSTITKKGAGVLQLTGANTYTKGTIINAGTVAISNVSGLGTGPVTINGGTLDASPAGNNKTFHYDLTIGSSGGTVTVADSKYSFFDSISGSGDLTTTGFVHFSGNGGYNGHLTINSGYVRVNPGSFGVVDVTLNSAGSYLNILNTGTLQIGKLDSAYDGEVFSSDSAAYTIEIGTGTTSSDTASYAGRICGISGSKNVTIKKVGAGTQTFNRTGYAFGGNNNSIKEVIIDEGKVIVDASHGTYTEAHTTGFWGTAPVTINSGATLEYKQAWTTSPNENMTINSGTLTLSANEYLNQLTLNSATINGSGELRAGKTAAAVWNVTGGTSTINNKIVLTKEGNYTTFTVNFDSGATLDVKNTITGLDGATGTDVVFNGTGENPGNVNFNSGAGIMKDLGSVTFNNMNVSVSGGSGWLNPGYFGESSVTLKDSTLTISRGHSTNGTTFTLDHGTMTANGEINTYIDNWYLKNGSTVNGTTANSTFRTGHYWNSNIYTQYEDGQPENVMNKISVNIAMFDKNKTMTFDIADKAPLTVSGNLIPADTGQYNALVKTGAGTLTLTGQNSHSTTTVSEGTLVLSGNGTLGTGSVTVDSGATLEFAYDSPTHTVNVPSITMTVGSETTAGSNFKVTSGSVTFGTTDVSLSNLSGGILNPDGTTVNSTLTVTGVLTLNNDQLTKFIGSISAATIEKTGDGTMQIYTGAEGQVDALSLTVSSGRMDFKGYMTGGITVDADTIFSPGNSVGEATFGGGYILNDGATLLIEQDATGMDKLTASSFEIHPNSILDLTLGSVQSGEYVILEQMNGDTPVDFGVVTIGGQTYDYSDVSFWNSLLSDDDAYYWNLSVNGNKVMASIDANAVPEPSTWALLVLGVVVLLLRKRVRN